REQEELSSWRTIGDIYSMKLPMFINIIEIGQLRKGYRPSPWTTSFTHPETGGMRIQPIHVKKFGPRWQRRYREQTDLSALEWLKLMQSDNAFEGIVHTINVDYSPPKRGEILAEMTQIADEIEKKSLSMRRSACFHYSPCPFAKICHHPTSITPSEVGWERRKGKSVASSMVGGPLSSTISP